MTHHQPDHIPTPETGATKGALTFIIATVVLDMLSIGLIVPIMPRLVEGFFPGRTVDAHATIEVESKGAPAERKSTAPPAPPTTR